MRLSARTNYAIRALVYLANMPEGSPPAQVEAIAGAQRIPPRFLPQIMGALKSAGIIRSRRGLTGGYILAKAPAAITLADVFACFEPEGMPSVATDDAITRALAELGERVENVLRQTTIATLAARATSTIPQYAI